MKKNGYPAQEKLKQTKVITQLFEKGKWKTSENIRIIIWQSDDFSSHQVGVSVSKKLHKKAKDRNRIKRLLREAYRLNKELYLCSFGANSVAMLFWVSKEMPKHYKIVESQFVNLCQLKKM